MVTTAAAALPMASSAIEMGAAASHSNDENVGGIATNAVPRGQRHKRARQMNQPTGPTDPAGLYKPNTEPVRSPYHIVSPTYLSNTFCSLVFLANLINLFCYSIL